MTDSNGDDVFDLGTIVLNPEKAKKKVEEKKTNIINSGIGKIVGLFSKKAKCVENEDGSVSRSLKVGKQELTVTAKKLENGTYQLGNMALDDENKQKLTAKINKGKKLSADEKMYVNCQDKRAVEAALVGMGFDKEFAGAHVPYTKEEITGQKAVDTFFVNLQGFTGDKVAFAAQVKAEMIKIYGKDAGEKHFTQFAELSGLNAEVQKLADKEKEVPAPKEDVTNKAPDEEKHRRELKADMTQDAQNQAAAPVAAPEEVAQSSVKDTMRDDEKIAKIEGLLSRPGVKLSQNQDEILNKLVEKFGAEAAYNIALKCVVEPLNAMKEMGEKFKRSGASIEYFAAIDPKDTEKMAKAQEVAGVELNGVKNIQQASPEIEAPQMPNVSVLGVFNDSLAKMNPMDVKITSPAEARYNKLLGDKEFLTVKDLADFGATKQDFDNAFKSMVDKDKQSPDNIQKLVQDGMGDEGASPVTKEFAVAVISMTEARQQLMTNKKKRTR